MTYGQSGAATTSSWLDPPITIRRAGWVWSLMVHGQMGRRVEYSAHVEGMSYLFFTIID